MTFQKMIETLNSFWASHGCVIAQPYGVEVGAGTANPHTFFRVLGPEPYNVAYVEPSRRPTDGRYGKNPNRLQHYYQYQVILKPAPKFNQELYLESLKALGVDITKHDIRFVEDNWESTPLGAWGLGWEVWLDGMEVSQYTYFQQVAGINLEVTALEITYGLERLAMYIQDVDDYRKIKWNDTVSYGDIFERHEFLQAKHNYETASIDTLQKLFDLYNTEVIAHLDSENYWAAYDYVLKLSHLFNLLDSRGVISVSDRIAKFAMIARYSKMIGKLYLEERKEMDYPLMKTTKPVSFSLPPKKVELATKNQPENIAVVELGFEEIPASYLAEWSETITSEWLTKSLETNDLIFDKAELGITPRRIVFTVHNPRAKIEYSELVSGPVWDIAFKDDKPTVVLEGFLKKNNAKIEDTEKIFKNEKVFVGVKRKVVITLEEILQKTISELLETAPRTKWMKWETQTESFIRPMRWIFAMHNDKSLKIDVERMNISSDTITYSPRYMNQVYYSVSSAQEYLALMQEIDVVLVSATRKNLIKANPDKTKELSPKYDHYVTQTVFLTESPKPHEVLLPAKYYELPVELINYILEKNQMYLLARKGKDIYYTIVANAKKASETIIDGNSRVVKARLEDGLFYMSLDKDIKLVDYRKKLANFMYHPKLGSYFVKVERIAAISAWILAHIDQPNGVTELVEGALPFIKNDRATNLAKEFPSLEGVIGYYYAKRDGVTDEVAQVIRNSVTLQVDKSNEKTTIASKIIALADAIDSYVGLSTAEGLPQGNHDPFEIRKYAQKILQLLTEENTMFLFSLREALAYAGTFVNTTKDSLTAQELFISSRIEQYFIENFSFPAWIATGVTRSTEPVLATKAAIGKALQNYEEKSQIKDQFLDALKRVHNILKDNEVSEGEVDEKLFETDAEKELFELMNELASKGPGERLSLFEKLAKTLEQFFATTRVAVEDNKRKQNRIALLAKMQALLSETYVLSFV